MQWSPPFFFNDTATTEIYTLSLHDALPISRGAGMSTSADSTRYVQAQPVEAAAPPVLVRGPIAWVRENLFASPLQADRKSTRLNSSHANISYAVFCLKKKKTLIISASCTSI